MAWCGVVLSVLASVGCKEDTGGEGGPPPPVPVTVMTVKAEDVPVDYEFVGQLSASQTVEIRARVDGFLTMRAFEEGGPIKKDDQLFQIDRRPFEAALEEAEARLERAEATRIRVEKDFERYKELLARQAATQKEYDDAETAVTEARAAVRFATAQRDVAELNLGYTDMLAPFDGVIGRAMVDVGSYVSPQGSNLLAEAMQTDPIYANFTISEREVLEWQTNVSAGRIRAAERDVLRVAIVRIDGTVYEREGRLNFVDVKVDPVTGSASLRAAIPNPEGRLQPGQFVRVRLIGNSRLGAIVIPQRAVIQTPTGAIAFAVNAEQKVEVRPLQLGMWVGSGWLVERGLTPGDRVIVDGIVRVQPGVVVSATEGTEPAAPAAAPSGGAAPTGSGEAAPKG